MNRVLLKRTLLGLWSLWWTVVLATNLADAAQALGALDPSWPFASGNYRLIAETTARHGPPAWVNAVLFAGVLLWEATATALFWQAFARHGSAAGRQAVYRAFTVGLSLWLAFLVADEVCIAYPVEASHLRLFTSQLLTLLAIELLPEG